jgi:hypothetical protein
VAAGVDLVDERVPVAEVEASGPAGVEGGPEDVAPPASPGTVEADVGCVAAGAGGGAGGGGGGGGGAGGGGLGAAMPGWPPLPNDHPSTPPMATLYPDAPLEL